MTGGKRLRIAALFVIVLVFAFIMDMSSNAITDNTLIRNDTGDGDDKHAHRAGEGKKLK